MSPLHEKLPASVQQFLRELGVYAKDRFGPLYLVGGPVRDLLLDAEVEDFDIMCEGDVSALLPALVDDWEQCFPSLSPPAKIVEFKRFHTAKLIFSEEVFPGVSTVDFSSARKEVYENSAAQPQVSRADLDRDLARRDFSVNAIAMSLVPERFGELHDPFTGCADIDRKILRVLHEKSFEDDPARMLRGLRFAARFAFSFDDETERLFGEGVAGKFLLRLPPFRLFDELKKALMEQSLVEVLELFDRRGLLAQIDSQIEFSTNVRDRLETICSSRRGDDAELGHGVSHKVWRLALVALWAEADAESFGDSLEKFELSEKAVNKLLRLREEVLS